MFISAASKGDSLCSLTWWQLLEEVIWGKLHQDYSNSYGEGNVILIQSLIQILTAFLLFIFIGLKILNLKTFSEHAGLCAPQGKHSLPSALYCELCFHPT